MKIETSSFSITGRLIKRMKIEDVEIFILSTGFLKNKYAFVRMEEEKSILYESNSKQIVDEVIKFKDSPLKAKNLINQTIDKIKQKYYIKKLKKYRPGADKEIKNQLNEAQFLPLVIWGGIEINSVF